jgi:hypothetical protein
MVDRTPNQVSEITGTTTYTGAYRLFWILIHAMAESVVTISDDTTELLSIGVAAKATEFICFVPSVTVKTSLVITLSSGTAKITTSRAGA